MQTLSKVTVKIRHEIMDFDEFWKQFLIECQEHIDIIEEHLLSAEHTPVNASGISELFRAFHSIKGLSKSMDLTGIESVAHVCEDILGLIRDKSAQFTAERVDWLLQGIDCLKEMIEQACSARANVDAPADLVRDLHQIFQEMKIDLDEDSSSSMETVAVPPSLVSQPHIEEPAIVNSASPGEFAPTFENEVPQDQLVVSHDDETVRYFIEALQYEINKLCDLHITEEDDKIKIQNVINTLRHSYQMMGFNNIMFGLEDILYCINDGEVKYHINLSRVFTDLHQMILNTGVPLISLSDNPLLNTEHHLFKTNLEDVKQFIESILEGSPSNFPKQDILDICLSFGYCLSNAYPDLPVSIFLDMEQILRQVEDPDNLDSARNTLTSLVAYIEEIERLLTFKMIPAGDYAAATDSVHAMLIDKISELSKTNIGQDTQVNLQKNIEVTPFIESVGIDLLSGLQKRFEDGGEEQVYVLMAYLEADQEIGEQFAMFATKQCELPFNRSVFIDNQNWYEFLIIYKHGQEQLSQELQKIDPPEQYLKLNDQQTAMLRDHIIQGVKQLKVAQSIQAQLHATEDQIDAQENQDNDEQSVKDVVTAKTAAPLAPPRAAASSNAVLNNDTIRIPGDVLDKFMNHIGEMVLACSHLNFTVASSSFKTILPELETQLRTTFEKHKIPANQVKEIFTSIDEIEKIHKNIHENNTVIHSILRYLQEGALNLRVIPLETVFKRLPRIVRDVSKQLDKKINLVLEGQEVRIDKSMVETLVDPLIHMLRNSIDHGIEIPRIRLENGKNETGTIRISAVQQGTQIRIDIQDDGYGLDPEKIKAKAMLNGLITEEANLSLDEIHQLIFHPGFSTAAVVTEVSGRGVGMDVVKSNVTRVGGSIAITSQKGSGTKISLKMPLSAAIQEVLIVKASGQILALPGRFVTEIIELPIEEVMSLRRHPAILLRDHFLPITHLGFILGFAKPKCNPETKITIVVLSDGQSTLGLHVEEIVNRSELYMKDVHKGIVNLPGVGGASILGDGRVVLILDGEGMLSLASKSPSTPYHFISKDFESVNEAREYHMENPTQVTTVKFNDLEDNASDTEAFGLFDNPTYDDDSPSSTDKVDPQ